MKKSFLTLLLILLTLSASKLEAGQIPYGDLFDRQHTNVPPASECAPNYAPYKPRTQSDNIGTPRTVQT